MQIYKGARAVLGDISHKLYLYIRRGENFPAKRVMMMEQQPYEEGSILEDTPEHGSMAELIELAEDREKWRIEVNRLKFGSIADPKQ